MKTLQRSKLLGAQVGGGGGVDSETKFNKLIKTLNSEFTYGIVILKDIAPPCFNNFCDLYLKRFNDCSLISLLYV